MPRKTKTTTAPKSAKKVAATTVVAEPVAAAPVVSEPVAVDTVAVDTVEVTLNDEFSTLYTQFSAMRSQMTAMAATLRSLQKRCDRELRTAQKASKKRSKKAGNRAPSGFVKPTEISKELASFLGKPAGTEMARTEVTREINQYIREHKLQDPANGRRILPDNKLRKLLKVGQSDELTYFNLQRFMSPHFTKSKAALAAASVSA